MSGSWSASTHPKPDSTPLEQSPEAQAAVNEHGVLMSREELAEFEERQEAGLQMRRAMEYAASLPAYGGTVEARAGESFRFLFTDLSADQEKRLRGLTPDPDRIEVGMVERTLEELRNEKRRIWEAFGDRIEGVGIDVRGNGLVVAVASEGQAEEFRTFVDRTTDVPVETRVGPNTDESCASRANCNNPQRAGVRLSQYSDGVGSYCSTSYVVRTSTGNEMALTAGHCWYGSTSGSRYGGSAGFFGTLTSQNSLYQGSEADARLVETANASTYNWLYHSPSNTQQVVGQGKTYYTTPVGTLLCIYAYVLQSGNCGSVEYIEFDYSSSTCGCTIYNAMLADYASVDGNSGGAVGSTGGYTAVGVHSGRSAGLGRFSHIEKVLYWLNVSLSVSP